jgi:hypothetical protein
MRGNHTIAVNRLKWPEMAFEAFAQRFAQRRPKRVDRGAPGYNQQLRIDLRHRAGFA